MDIVLKKISDIRPYEKNPRKNDEAVKYVADFTYTDANTGYFVVEDVKGFRTKDYIIKRKLMLWVHHIRIKEV